MTLGGWVSQLASGCSCYHFLQRPRILFRIHDLCKRDNHQFSPERQVSLERSIVNAAATICYFERSGILYET